MRLQLDAYVLLDLYERCPSRQKLVLAGAVAFSLLEPKNFHPFFQDVYARRMPVDQRTYILDQLNVFLRKHPREAAKYRALILGLMRSPEWEFRIKGLVMAGFIDDLGRDDLDYIKRKLSASGSYERMAALDAFASMLRRERALDPQVREYCVSDPLLTRVRRMRRQDRNELVRLGAKNMLYAYNQTLRPRGRRPRGRRTSPDKGRDRGRASS